MVKKKISTKCKVTMPRKIYNANSSPVKTTPKRRRRNLLKAQIQKIKNQNILPLNDNVLTDESVTNILCAYFIPHYVPWSGLYHSMYGK